MAYYIYVENEKINGCGECQQLTENVQNVEVTETLYNDYSKNPLKYIYENGKIVINPNYEDEIAQGRKEDFESKFLTTSLGNYRLTPKGYANAQQSIDTINNIVNALGGLTEQIAKKVLFYETPDFTKEEQCTEEWLIEHQYSANPMSKEEWINFYIEFSTLYAEKQYQS